MRALWRRFKNGYLNLNLQTKFTIALISIVVIPACLTAFLFYGRLYSMVVSNTIRQEQDASAKTAPLIERTMDTILATTRNITGQNFFQELFYMPVSDSAEQLATSNHATDFKNAVQRLTTDSIVTDVQIYVDFPDDLKTLDTYPNTKNILAPLSQAKVPTGTVSFRETGTPRKCSVLPSILVPGKKRIMVIWHISAL